MLRRASIDHSYVQELVATGHITEAEARTHPRRNIVTRALGIEPQVRVDTWTLRLVQGDRYVLCSDGLVDEVDDGEIQDVLNRIDDPQEAAEELVALANVARRAGQHHRDRRRRARRRRSATPCALADDDAAADADTVTDDDAPTGPGGGPEAPSIPPRWPTVGRSTTRRPPASTTMVVTAEPATTRPRNGAG